MTYEAHNRRHVRYGISDHRQMKATSFTRFEFTIPEIHTLNSLWAGVVIGDWAGEGWLVQQYIKPHTRVPHFYSTKKLLDKSKHCEKLSKTFEPPQLSDVMRV